MRFRDKQRFYARAALGTQDECRLWLGGVGSHGYGWICLSPARRGGQCKGELAHRFAYELAYGGLPGPGLEIRHLCGNRLCCNPCHLRAGTRSENAQDTYRMGRRGQRPKLIGGQLSEEQVQAILDLYPLRGYTQQRLGRIFGISHTMVSLIVNGKAWKRLADPES